jgi:cephalosporin-C deacetylase
MSCLTDVKGKPMALVDSPLSDLYEYRASVVEPVDFEAFWRRTLDEARASAQPPQLKPDLSLPGVEVIDLRYSGFGGHPIAAWLIRPLGAGEAVPTVVGFNGYGGGRGLPHEHLAWVAAGYGYAFMDTRGQGAWWGGGGSTGDPVGHDASGPGYVTRGLERPDDFYYRRVFTDAVRLIETLRELPGFDPVAVTGISQGGGIAIAVAGLVDGLRAAMPDVPFGSHWRHSVDHSDEDPYAEVRRYLSVHSDRVDQVFGTLAYFDAVNFASHATAPALFSVGLMDPVCLPTTVFAARNAWTGEARIEVYPFGDHGGGGPRHFPKQLAFLNEVIAR